MQPPAALWLGLTLATAACGCGPGPAAGAGTSSGAGSTLATGGSGAGSTTGTATSEGTGGTAGSTGSGGTSGGGTEGSSGAGAAILAGTLGFTVVFEGEFNLQFADGGLDPGAATIFFSDYDFSPYCGAGDGGPIYLPNPIGAQVAIVILITDGGAIQPGTYAASADPDAVLVGGPGLAVEEGLANSPYDVSTSGSMTVQATSPTADGLLLSGYFHASLTNPDGGLAGTLSGSFPANPCPGAGHWQ